ncbi:MAG TPA: carboxymuconolactone decarboxylase family protein [Nevskiaceae bacterium]|nr:carboxymuconolactone decarboxylase family protein [Nevskiaceae bacterium]
MQARLDFQKLAPEGARALHSAHDYLDHCSLPEQLVDLVYLRVSQINGCGFCIDMHSRDLLKVGFPADKLRLVPVWHELGDFFTARERAALHWAESLTRLPETGAPDADYAVAKAAFSDKELVDLTLAIAMMNAYNRLGVGFRVVPQAVAKASQRAG